MVREERDVAFAQQPVCSGNASAHLPCGWLPAPIVSALSPRDGDCRRHLDGSSLRPRSTLRGRTIRSNEGLGLNRVGYPGRDGAVGARVPLVIQNPPGYLVAKI